MVGWKEKLEKFRWWGKKLKKLLIVPGKLIDWKSKPNSIIFLKLCIKTLKELVMIEFPNIRPIENKSSVLLMNDVYSLFEKGN